MAAIADVESVATVVVGVVVAVVVLVVWNRVQIKQKKASKITVTVS